MADFVIKRNDLEPIIEAVLYEADGTVRDLTTSTVKFSMRRKGSTTNKVSTAASIDVAASGEVSYTWAGEDTDTEGDYIAEWEETTSGSKKVTYPNNRFINISIVKDLA